MVLLQILIRFFSQSQIIGSDAKFCYIIYFARFIALLFWRVATVWGKGIFGHFTIALPGHTTQVVLFRPYGPHSGQHGMP